MSETRTIPGEAARPTDPCEPRERVPTEEQLRARLSRRYKCARMVREGRVSDAVLRLIEEQAARKR